MPSNHTHTQTFERFNIPHFNLPNLTRTFIGFLALTAPTAATSRRLQENLQPMILQGFKTENSTCLRRIDPAINGYSSDSFKIQKTDCGLVEAVATPITNATEWTQIVLKEGDVIQCKPADNAQKNRQALDSSLQCISDAYDQWKHLQDRAAALSIPVGVGGSIGILQGLFEATILGLSVGVSNLSPKDIYSTATTSLLFGTAFGLAEQALGYLCGLLFNLRFPDSFTTDNLKRSCTGTALLAAAAISCIAARALFPGPSNPHLPRFALQMGLLVSATIALQRGASFLVGSAVLEANIDNAEYDFLINAFGGAVIAPFSIGFISLCTALEKRNHLANNPEAVQIEAVQMNDLNNGLPQNHQPQAQQQISPRAGQVARLAQTHNGVHVHNNTSIAREQIKKLKELCVISENAPAPLKESDDTTWARIHLSLTLTSSSASLREDGPQGRTYNLKQSAQQFFNSLERDINVFNAEFGDLGVNPRQVVAMVWRVAMAKAVEQAPSSEVVREVMAQKLIDQCARISTSVHGTVESTVNPCGSGKVASLLQFAQTLVPELDLFAQKFETPPQSQVIRNEFYASFARDVKYLLEHPETLHPQHNNLTIEPTDNPGDMETVLDAQIKSHLEYIYVDQDQKMNQEVFEALYQGYLQALGA